MTNYKHLRALCDAATDGEWTYEYKKIRNSEMYSGQVFDENGENIAELSWHPVKTSTGVRTDREENGKFIAATDPQTVRALIDEVERYRAALERIASAQTMTVSFTRKDNQEGRELLARQIYAQQALKGTGHE